MTKVAPIQLEVGRYDPDARRLERPQGPVRLTPIEDRLLRYLAERPSRTVSHEELLTEVWGYAAGVRSRTVYTTVDRLRQKIELDPAHPRHLIALSAAGYCFEPPPQRSRIPAGLVGRAPAWEALTAMVGAGAVVTVTGTGGVGKTRLARAFADATHPGHLFCDLSACRTPPEIHRAVAEALDIPLLGDDRDQVARALAARADAGPLLVIVDNFEQVAEHAEETLGRWSTASPRIGWLVTSRTPLGLDGERVLALEPLDVVGEDSPAAALFCQRGQLSAPGFSPTGAELRDIAELVARLDGIPLAIELAAARLKLLSPAEMVSRLDQRFRLLGHDPERPARQSSLVACLEWSWDLLAAWERAALAQLSVFEGGFTLDAAEGVIELPPDAPWTLDVLSALVDSSLLCRRHAGDSRRFELLHSVREFAATRLRGEISDPAAVERRHGLFFARWGDPTEIDALRTRQGVTVRRDRLRDLPNLLVAARRALARRDPAIAARTGLAAANLLVTRGPYVLLASLLDDLLAAPDIEQRVELSILRGWAATMFSRPQEAEAPLQECLERARASGARSLEGRVLTRLGTLRQFQGRVPESEGLFRDALTLLKGDPKAEIQALEGLAFAHDFQGRFDEGRRCFEAVLAAHQAAADLQGEASTTCNLGNLLWRMGRSEAAVQAMHRALALDREMENRRAEAIDLMNLGVFLLNLGRLEEARRSLEEAMQLHRTIGNRGSEGSALYNLATTDWLLGRLSEAEGRFREALAIQRQVGNTRAQGITRGDLGGLYQVTGRMAEAEEELVEALRLATETGNTLFSRIARCWLALALADQDRLAEARARLDTEPWSGPIEGMRTRVLAEIALHDGDLDAVTRLAEEGHRQLVGPTTTLFRAELFGLQGLVALRRGDLEAAGRHLRTAEALLRQGQLRMAMPRLLAQRAALERALGTDAEARSTVAEARALATEMGIGNPRVMGWLAALDRP